MSKRQDNDKHQADWSEYRHIPVSKLALQLSADDSAYVHHVLQQVGGWQRIKDKVPTWAENLQLRYPPRLALEQCSGEAAARYKADVARRLTASAKEASLVDLTGGFGVDFSFIAPPFTKACYVERQEELCSIAQHNFPLLGLTHSTLVCGDAESFLHEMPCATLIYIDPARRDKAGHKTVLIEDCQPNVCRLQNEMLEKADFVLIKLSPMLDMANALRQMNHVRELHVTAFGGECKDLLLVLERGYGGEPRICICEGGRTYSFSPGDEQNATVCYARQVGKYIYEPGAALLKAGAFKWTAQHFGLEKLHPHSHLYTCAKHLDDFPGRTFEVVRTWNFSKQQLNALRKAHTQANLTVRNFPASVDALRKKLKLREGGSTYLFATTLTDNTHTLIEARKPGE